jgi:transposase-like protein
MDDDPSHPDPEVPQRAQRRRFSAEYKARIVAEYDKATPVERGALLRREGLYSSHLADWRKAAASGAIEALARKRGRPGPDARDRRIAHLEARNAALTDELAKARKVIDVQGKLSALLSDLSESAGPPERSTP